MERMQILLPAAAPDDLAAYDPRPEALAAALDLPPGAPLALFALGRTAGWIGHALEQYSTGQLIRPRARYVGEAPGGR